MTRIIVKPIFKAKSGYWWAYSQVRPGRVYSLHTRDGAKAQADYNRQVAELRRYIAMSKPTDAHDPADAGMDNPPEDELSDLSGQLECLTVAELIEAATAAIRAADERYSIVGTSDNPTGYGPPYRAPWFLVDGSKADMDVGYIGDLIEESDDTERLVASRFRLLAKAALSSAGRKAEANVPEPASDGLLVPENSNSAPRRSYVGPLAAPLFDIPAPAVGDEPVAWRYRFSPKEAWTLVKEPPTGVPPSGEVEPLALQQRVEGLEAECRAYCASMQTIADERAAAKQRVEELEELYKLARAEISRLGRQTIDAIAKQNAAEARS